MSCIIHGALAREEGPALGVFLGVRLRAFGATARQPSLASPEEPAAGLPSRSSRSERRLERVKGIEPSSSAWKAVALPLSYTRILVPRRPGRQARLRRRRTIPMSRPLGSQKPTRAAHLLPVAAARGQLGWDSGYSNAGSPQQGPASPAPIPLAVSGGTEQWKAGGGGWIRTNVGEANGFTVRPL